MKSYKLQKLDFFVILLCSIFASSLQKLEVASFTLLRQYSVWASNHTILLIALIVLVGLFVACAMLFVKVIQSKDRPEGPHIELWVGFLIMSIPLNMTWIIFETIMQK